jgi:hypothetical protein
MRRLYKEEGRRKKEDSAKCSFFLLPSSFCCWRKNPLQVRIAP